MAETIRDPCQHVQGHILVGGQDIADVGTVEDVLQGGQHTDPNSWAPIARHKPATVLAFIAKDLG